MLVVDAVLGELLVVGNLTIPHHHILMQLVPEQVHLLDERLLLRSYGRSRRILILLDLLHLEVELVQLFSGFSDHDVHLLDRLFLQRILRLLRPMRSATGASCRLSSAVTSGSN